MNVPLTVLFFPGVVLHELSHVVACLIAGVKVHKVKWFGVTEAFVQHDKPGALSGLVISLSPLLVGNGLGIFSLRNARSLLFTEPILALVLLWMGVSMVLFSFPSRQDAENTFNAFWDSYKKKLSKPKPVLSRAGWALTVPFVFAPLILLLGFLILLDSFFLLRLIWVLAVLLTVFL